MLTLRLVTSCCAIGAADASRRATIEAAAIAGNLDGKRIETLLRQTLPGDEIVTAATADTPQQ
jgi:hypothetical protein